MRKNNTMPLVYKNIKSWKSQARETLAQQYIIVGCIGDRDVDFEGGNIGYKVKLPNYLY